MNKSFKIVSVVSLVVGLIALVASFTPKSVPVAPQTLGGVYSVNNTAPTFTDGIDMGALPVRENWAGGTLGSKINNGFWRNLTGATATVDYVEMQTTGIASSSYKLYAYATSSAPRTIYDFTAPSNSNSATFGSLLINGKVIATSSVATTTSSDDVNVPQAGTAYMVGPNQYMDFLLFSANGSPCASQAAAICESATSTNRGFNVNWRLHYHN